VNRRNFMLLLGGAVTAARALHAQQKAMPVIGWLSSGSPRQRAPIFAAFHQGLSESGWVEGQNLAIEYRWAEGHYDRLPMLAADLVDRKVDVIVTGNTNGITAAKGATATIPIVFFGGGDLMAAGLIKSLARPGGNLTGISIMGPELGPKRLDLLSELLPDPRVIALLVNPNSKDSRDSDSRRAGSCECQGPATRNPEGWCRRRFRACLRLPGAAACRRTRCRG